MGLIMRSMKILSKKLFILLAYVFVVTAIILILVDEFKTDVRPIMKLNRIGISTTTWRTTEMAVLDLSAPGSGKDTVIPIHRLNTTKNNEHLIHSQDVEMRTLTYRDELNLSDNINHNITTEERKPEQKIGENTTEVENKKRLSAEQRHLKEHVNSTTKSTNYTIGISEQIYFKDINIPQMSKDKKIVTVYSPNTSNAFNINMDKKRIRDYHISQLQCTLPSVTAHNIDTYVEKQARIFQQQHLTWMTNYKNPCWKESNNLTLYKSSNMYGKFYHRCMERSYEKWQGMGKVRIRCLPYVFLAGITKSGTTDLHGALVRHPNISKACAKEPEWWGRRSTGFMENGNQLDLLDYTAMFDGAAASITENSLDGYHPSITVDASPSTFWEMHRWPLYPGNEGSMFPVVTNAHLLHAILPDAKIIVIFRNPIDRLYSHYNHRCVFTQDGVKLASPTEFDRRVRRAIERWTNCTSHRSQLECVYDACMFYPGHGLNQKVTLRAGMYHIYLQNWLRVFPKKQIKVVIFEDYVQNRHSLVVDIVNFLQLGKIPDEMAHHLEDNSVRNSGLKRNNQTEEMLPETRKLLSEFYMPFNKHLEDLLTGTYNLSVNWLNKH